MAIHSRIFVWRIPWMEKPSGATVHRIAKSQKLLKRLSMHTHSATHCRITQKLQSLPSGCAPVPLGALAPGLLPLSLMRLSLRDSHPDPSGWVQILLDSGPVSKRPCVSTQKHACVCESQYGHHCASVQVCVRACVCLLVWQRGNTLQISACDPSHGGFPAFITQLGRGEPQASKQRSPWFF